MRTDLQIYTDASIKDNSYIIAICLEIEDMERHYLQSKIHNLYKHSRVNSHR